MLRIKGEDGMEGKGEVMGGRGGWRVEGMVKIGVEGGIGGENGEVEYGMKGWMG